MELEFKKISEMIKYVANTIKFLVKICHNLTFPTKHFLDRQSNGCPFTDLNQTDLISLI